MKHIFLDSRARESTGKVAQELICKRYLSQRYGNWMGSFLVPDRSSSWPFCTFLCFVIIICKAELDQCWIGPREGRTPRAPNYPYMHTLTRPYLNHMYMGWTFLPKTRTFSVCFFINEDNWWLWDSIMSRDHLPLNLVPIEIFPGFWINWDGHKR